MTSEFQCLEIHFNKVTFGRSVGFDLPFVLNQTESFLWPEFQWNALSDFEGILHASQMVHFLCQIHEHQAYHLWWVRDLKKNNQNVLSKWGLKEPSTFFGHPTKHWNIFGVQLLILLEPFETLIHGTQHKSTGALAPFTPPCSRPTKPWDKSWRRKGQFWTGNLGNLISGVASKVPWDFWRNSDSISKTISFDVKSLERWIAKICFNRNSQRHQNN